MSALTRVFEQAVKAIDKLAPELQEELWTRLDVVRDRSHKIGYGMGEAMDVWLDEQQDSGG